MGAHVNTAGPGAAILLFNPAGQKATGYVEYEPWTEWESWEGLGYSLVDEQGEAVPYQLVDTHEALTRPAHGIVRLVFRASVPAMGYRTYRFAPGLPVAAPLPDLTATPTTLDNGRIQLRLDEHTGAIVSCLDTMTGTEFVGRRGWNVAQVLEDRSDTWSHRIPGFAGPILGEFHLVESRVADLGPLQASIVVDRVLGASRWTQQIVVRRDSDAILIRNWVNWDGQWQTVKLAFDVNTPAPEATHDVAFGHCRRPCDGAEVPTQMWMDVSGPLIGEGAKQIGAALLNDGKYGCDVNGSVMRLTILRSPPYAYHEPHQFGVKARYDWVDQGYQEFVLEVRPHLGDWRDAGIVEAARAINMPMLPVTMHAHSGDLPTQSSLLGVTGDDLEMTALKPAEDGDGAVLRLADRHGRGASGTVRWMGVAFEVALRPSEIATYRISRVDGEWRLTDTNMLERPT
ncbi:MAG: hypothetical protein IPK16_26655 [Anaerolineales bacterium]|nr:hypothetical protein [Anaerolineales bacterium]